MTNKCEEKIDIILEEVRELRKDVDDLKRFKNRVLGGLAVFVLVVQTMGSYIFGQPR